MLPEKVKTLLCHRDYKGVPLTVRHVLKLESLYRPGHALFRKWNIEPDVAIGIIGDRGTGKTISVGLIVVTDYMMLGQPCYSNTRIALEVEVDDSLEQTLREYEEYTGTQIKREPVRYESLGLNIAKLLSPDCDYYDGVIVVDEINIEMADSWRTMTNQALLSSDFMQLLRKLRSAFVFSCISEMFVPNRVRDAVDIYIQTRDMAFINESPLYGKHQGENFEWRIYPMTGKLAGYKNTFEALRRPYETFRVRGRKCWGLVDTYERKRREKHVSSLYQQEPEGELVPMVNRDALLPEIEERQSIIDAKAKWGWLYEHPFIYKMLDSAEKVDRFDLLEELASSIPDSISDDEVLAHFEKYLNPRKTWSGGRKYYWFGTRERAKVAVPA